MRPGKGFTRELWSTLLDERDADLKDEALYDMFERMCERHPEPKEPTWEDVRFISKVLGDSPEQVKESLEQISGEKITVPC